jgi:hypothetical protein
MKTTSYELLVNAAGQLMQQHAFDHLSDEKLSRMQSCFRRIGASGDNAEMAIAETELLSLCSEANLYVDTATTQSLHQWYAAMSCFGGLMASPSLAKPEEAE